MLDDAVAGFLDSVSERGLDEPLLAALRSLGFTNLHLTHGSAEFGKDLIGQHDGEQWAFQSKQGNISQSEFRELTGQLDELRTNDLSHPEFRIDLPRRAVLVTTGRLVGNAGLSAQDYSRRAREKGEPGLEVWGRDRLIGLFASDPNAALRGSVDGQLLGLLGAIDQREVNIDAIERFSVRWTNMEASRVASLGIVEAAIACERLRATDRVDLACQLALCAVRGAWASQSDADERQLAADAGAALFEEYALGLWNLCEDGALDDDGLLAYGAGMASYPVRAMRVAELLGLLALRVRAEDPDTARRIAAFLGELIRREPGTMHPIGDRYGVSLIPIALTLASEHRETARCAIERTAVWLCDRYERGELGLAAVDAPADQEVARLLGAPFEAISEQERRSSLVGSVLLDLAALLDFGPMHSDVRNDIQAVRLYPSVLLTGDSRDQFLLEGEGNRWDYNPDYADELQEGAAAAPHLAEETTGRALAAEGRWWDLLAVSAVLRDRHFVAAIRAALVPEA